MTERRETLPEFDPLATVDYFDAEASGWAARYQQNRHFQARLETVLHWLEGYSSGQELLDYGCGSGVLVQALAKAGHHVTGADISEGMLAEARKNLKTIYSGGQVRLVPVNNQFEGDYTDRVYDGIISLGVLEYLDEPSMLLERFSQQLKPGGFLILSFPNRSSWLRRMERWVYQHPHVFRTLNLFPHLTGPGCYLQFQRNQWTVDELHHLLSAADYYLRRVRYHVAPTALHSIEDHPSIGMTAITKFIKSSKK